MQKLESLDSAVFQILDDEESLALVGGEGDQLIEESPDGCKGTAGATSTVNGPDVKADVRCTF